MKYCTNCGTKIADDAMFCEECGTKQETIFQENDNSKRQEGQQTFSTSNHAQTTKNSKFKYLVALFAIILLIVAIIIVVRSCSSPASPEDVASDFAEALFIDFKAKKAVSLMSDELIDSYMEQMDFSSKNELIDRLDATLKIRKEDTIEYYGDDWKAKVIDAEIKDAEDGFAVVIVSISHEGSDALWNTNIDELWVYLVYENDKWRVYDYEG